MGDEIPADGRVVVANDLHIDQSLLTGESDSVAKAPLRASSNEAGSECAGCISRGTHVVEGRGEMIVCAVGAATSFGQLAARLTDVAPDQVDSKEAGATTNEDSERIRRKQNLAKLQTPLQEKLEKLAKAISKLGYAAALAIFVAQIVRGIWQGELIWPGRDQGILDDLMHDLSVGIEYFMYMVIVIVVAVPEGLPMSVTISLALAMRKMTRANCLVRQLAACETVGSTTVICSDKTGTITQNHMRVVYFGCDGIEANFRRAPHWLAPAQDETPLSTLLLIAARQFDRSSRAEGLGNRNGRQFD